jgi:chromosome segregation ATPase
MSAMRDDDDHVACARHARPSGDANDAGPADGWPADTARARLAGLQHDAAEAYAAITAAEDALRALATHRVAAERALRLAAARHQAAARAVAGHARARPGLFARLATRFRAEGEWRRQQLELASAFAAAERQLCTARQALSDVKEGFAARLAARAAAAARLRHLTAECRAALARIAAAGGGPPGEDAAATLRGGE